MRAKNLKKMPTSLSRGSATLGGLGLGCLPMVPDLCWYCWPCWPPTQSLSSSRSFSGSQLCEKKFEL